MSVDTEDLDVFLESIIWSRELTALMLNELRDAAEAVHEYYESTPERLPAGVMDACVLIMGAQFRV